MFLDEYIRENGGKIDYIHGKDVTYSLAANENSIGFILPDMDYIRQMPGCKCNKRTLFDVFDPIF